MILSRAFGWLANRVRIAREERQTRRAMREANWVVSGRRGPVNEPYALDLSGPKRTK